MQYTFGNQWTRHLLDFRIGFAPTTGTFAIFSISLQQAFLSRHLFPVLVLHGFRLKAYDDLLKQHQLRFQDIIIAFLALVLRPFLVDAVQALSIQLPPRAVQLRPVDDDLPVIPLMRMSSKARLRSCLWPPVAHMGPSASDSG